MELVFVGHPKRKVRKKKFNINGQEETVEIHFDGIKKDKHNEDPYIWSESFLYTFCHAYHAMPTRIRSLDLEKEDVYFVFVANVPGLPDRYEIDTIIKAKQFKQWPEKGKRHVSNLDAKIFTQDVVTHHLPAITPSGNLTEHNNEKLFTCVGDPDQSFLPMERDSMGHWRPYQVQHTAELSSLIKVSTNNRNYPANKQTSRVRKSPTLQMNFDVVQKEVEQLIEQANQSGVKNRYFVRGSQLVGNRPK